MRKTVRQIIEKFTDIKGSFFIDNLLIGIQEKSITADTEYTVTEAESNLQNGKLFDSNGQEWTYVPNKTYSVSSLDNCFTLGYVYLP